jgi:hypothetical protein
LIGWRLVDYRDVRFSKTGVVLEGMGISGLKKSEQAQVTMRDPGLLDRNDDHKGRVDRWR